MPSSALVMLLLALALYAFDGYEVGFQLLNESGRILPEWFWQGVTSVGHGVLLFAVTSLLSRRYPHLFWALVIAAVVGTLISRGLKPLAEMPRPPAVLAPDAFTVIGPAFKRHSFPSGHALAIFLFVGVAASHARHTSTRLALVTLATLVGWSRIVVGVHWPIDVIVGAAAGLLAAYVGLQLSQRLRFGLSLGPHLCFVAIAVACSIKILVEDPQYPDGIWLSYPLAAISLAYGLYSYVIGTACRRSQRKQSLGIGSGSRR